jgi:hypothetical protein
MILTTIEGARYGGQLPADVVDIRYRVWLADFRWVKGFEEKKKMRQMSRAVPTRYGSRDPKGKWVDNGKRRTIEKKWTNWVWTLSLLAE